MPITRRSFLTGLTVGAAALAGCQPRREGEARGEGEARRRPNIVLMVVDELGYYELSMMGHPHYKTPNVDRLAARGVRFTQGLAGSSVCAPTRCCLMTGKHSGHTSVRANDGGTPLREGEETIGSVLKQAGYATGGFGKWGCGGRGSTGVPEKHGFDVFFGYYDQVHAHSYYAPYLVRNSEEVPLEGNKGLSDGKTYSHYVIWNAGMDFIRENKDRPFFCYLPVTPPHGIHDIPDTDPSWALYKDEPWPEAARRYAAMVNMVDRNLGELVALLKKLGLEQDTLILFSGDNGGADYFRDAEHPRGFHGPNVDPRTGRQFRGQKGNLYEGGLRIPMIAYWPGRIRPGRVSDFLWYFPDVMPTLAEVAGAPVPKDIDGISVVPELLGADAAGRAQTPHEFLYWELGAQTAVRLDHWKAVRPGKDAPWELYDLRTDSSEEKDVSAVHPDVLARAVAVAQREHVDVVPGVFLDRTPHIKDRCAKFGTPEIMPQDGLIPMDEWKVVRFSSQSRPGGKVAAKAIDGDPMTWWHTQWEGQPAQPPHELVIDMGRTYAVRGFRILPRQDAAWNGTIKDCEFFVSDDAKAFATPAARATLTKTRKAQEVTFSPVRGRYVMLRVLSEVDGGPWASVAELGVVGGP
jgi:arylsulfatase A-like enzyme